MVFIQTLCTLLLVASSFIVVECRSYNNGLIFYNLENHNSYLPPTISVSRGRGLAKFKYSPRGSIWSTFGKPCHCEGPLCGCCVGIQVKQYNFDQKICANVSYVLPKEEIQLDVFLNDTATAKYGIAARNPSPLCIPIMMGIPMSMCIQMSNIGVQGDNLNMCMDFLVRLASTELFEMHFQCMKVGLQGASWVGSDGQPVIPANEGKIKNKSTNESEDYYDESEAEAEQEKEIISMEKNEENIDMIRQDEDLNKAEEEMDYNDITDKIRDIVKEQDKETLQENAQFVKDNQIVHDNKQVEEIVTNIMDSINDANAAEEIEMLQPDEVEDNISGMNSTQESAILEDNENYGENSYFIQNEVNRIANVENNLETNVLGEKETLKETYNIPTELLQNELESLEQEVDNANEGTINPLEMEKHNEIINGSQNAAALLNIAMKDEFHLKDLFENSQEKETQMENNPGQTQESNKIKIENQESQKINNKPELEITTFQETSTKQNFDDLNSTTDQFDMLSNTNDAEETTKHVIKNDSELNNSLDMLQKTSEISASNAIDNALTTAAIMTAVTTTTKNKPMKSDKTPDVAITSIENTNGINRNNNENDDQDEDNESEDGDNSDCSYSDNSHENDSDYEDKESEEMENETTENEIELNKATTIALPTVLELNNKNDISHELPNESNSNESYSNDETNENTKDIFETEKEEFKEYSDNKYQNFSDEHYEDFDEEKNNGDYKDYVTKKLAIEIKEINTESNTCCKSAIPSVFNNSHVTTIQQLDDNNNNLAIPQIDNATGSNLQFASNSNSMINKADDDNLLNVESTTNKISQIIATSTSAAAKIATSTATTSSNIMPLPLARKLYSIHHKLQQKHQQHHRHSRQRQHYV